MQEPTNKHTQLPNPIMDMAKPMTENQLQFRRDIEPIIKGFKNHTITMRDAMNELEKVFLTTATDTIAARDTEIARLRDAIDRAESFMGSRYPQEVEGAARILSLALQEGA